MKIGLYRRRVLPAHGVDLIVQNGQSECAASCRHGAELSPDILLRVVPFQQVEIAGGAHASGDVHVLAVYDHTRSAPVLVHRTAKCNGGFISFPPVSLVLSLVQFREIRRNRSKSVPTRFPWI